MSALAADAPNDLRAWLDRQLIASRDRMAACVSATHITRARPEFYQTITPARGSVLAAMSVGPDERPDYFFHWLRDSALVMAAFEMLRRMGAMGDIADPFPDFVAFSAGLAALDGRALLREGKIGRAADPNLRQYLRLAAELEIVHGDRARGDVRFNPDGSLDVIYWARPQFDGPALLAMLMTARAIDAVSEPPEQALLVGDLDYLARVCHEPCFDLWEERFGHHYHTRLVTLAALEGGATWRAGRGETAASLAYQRVARELRAALDTHWSEADGFYLAASRGGEATPRDLDAAVILAVAQARIRSGPHSVLDPRAQATLLKLEELFETTFPINRERPIGHGVLHGRFPHDGYYGGGAFPFTTCAAAAFHYRIAAALRAGSVLARRAENAAFLARCDVGPGEPEHESARKFIARGDAILAALRRVTPADGSMAEQIDKTTGAPASARDLPMSHAAFILAYNARRLAAE